ncbi:MAG: DUF1330 domain-containing protein [Pseudomonadota bacterium]
MPKGYWIVHVDVTDAENYPQYLAQDKLAFDKFEAKFLVRGGECTGPEGPIRARHVVIEFDTYEKALECYNSPEYQKAVPLRQAFSNSDVIIVEGTE